MLPPHELKNKDFPKAVRGYSMVDVDEHIEFIIQKYTDLYRANDELERKLQKAEADLKDFRSDEESIRSALINAQRASAQIISEANERADVILRSAKTNCDKIVAEFNGQIKGERGKLIQLRKVISDFKVSLFNQYTSHIEFIENIAPEPVEELDEHLASADYTKLVVERIKKDISTGNIQEYGDTLPKSARESVLPEPVVKNIEKEESPLDLDDMMTTLPPKKKALPEPEKEKKPISDDEIYEDIEEIEDIEEETDDSVPEFISKPFVLPEPEPEPQLDIKQKQLIPEESNNKTLSMKDRIRQLNKKFEEEKKPDEEGDFDDDYDDFVKSMEVNKKKKKN